MIPFSIRCIQIHSIKDSSECNKATPSEYLNAEVRNMNVSKQIILIQYGTTWIINISAIPFSYTESHVLQNNANKSFPVLSKVAICLHQHCDSGRLVETLFNKPFKCLYPDIPWNPKVRRLILKAPQPLWNLTDGTAAQQLILLSNYRAIGVFLISI